MKNVNKLVFLALAGALAFTGCKKGADDPAISLRSRDSRLEGEWTLSSIEGTATVNNTDVTTGSTNSSSSTTVSKITTTTSYSSGVKSTDIDYSKIITPSLGTVQSKSIKQSKSVEQQLTMKIDKNGDVTCTTVNGNATKFTITQNSSPVLSTTSTTAVNGIDSYNYDIDGDGNSISSLDLDGTYNSLSSTGNKYSNTSVTNAYWNYVGDKKEEIYISGFGTFEITRLANKELKLKRIKTDNSKLAQTSVYGTGTFATSTITNNDDQTSVDETWTFKQ